MSSLRNLLSRLVSGLFASRPGAPDPEQMSFHDWADLPAHHPASERTPC